MTEIHPFSESLLKLLTLTRKVGLLAELNDFIFYLLIFMKLILYYFNFAVKTNSLNKRIIKCVHNF